MVNKTVQKKNRRVNRTSEQIQNIQSIYKKPVKHKVTQFQIPCATGDTIIVHEKKAWKRVKV